MISSALRASVSALAIAVFCAACSAGDDRAHTHADASATPSPHVHVTASTPSHAHASRPSMILHAAAIPSPSARGAAHVSNAVRVPNSVAVGPPFILSARVTPSTVTSGTTVSAWLSTTAGVVTVTAYAGGSSLALHRIAAGQFGVATTLPPLPSYVSGVFPVTFVARDARGRSTQTAVNVTVR